jgi:hypothetical protein
MKKKEVKEEQVEEVVEDVEVEEAEDTASKPEKEEKPKKVSKLTKFFNIIYVITTIFSYAYYVYYAVGMIQKNGLDHPLSILFMIAIAIYTLILLVCAVISSSIKTAKARIGKAMKLFGYFKKSIKVFSTALSVIALISVVQSPDTSMWTMIVSIFNIIMNIIKIWMAIAGMMFSAGKAGVKAIVKSKKAKKKAEKEAKKQAKLEAKEKKKLKS